MKNLMTRKLLFGMLMMLVLAFSRQGVCDPLKLTARSDTTQVKQPTDAPFEIQFSVQLNSNAIAYNLANPRKRVTDDNDLATALRIDSSGHQVTDILGKEYRNSAAATALSAPAGGALVVGPRPQYPTDTNGIDLPDTKLSGTPTATKYVDTGRNVVDGGGDAVYIRTGTGTRYSNNDTPNDRTDDTLADPYKYERAKADPDLPVDEEDRFDYNEEEVRVTVDPASADINISVKGSNYFVTTGTDLTEVGAGILKSSMTLVCDTQAAGSYTITLEDATEAKDYPRNAAPLEIGDTGAGVRRSKIVFTLHVTTETVETTNSIVAWNTDAETGTPYLRIDTGKDIEHISNDFVVTPTDGNLEIRYKIIRGRGTLYAGPNSDPKNAYAGPNQDLPVHQSANVYLNTKGTTNEVAASITGQDRQTHTATIVYEYSGSGGSTTTTTTTRPTTPTTPTPTTPSLTLFPLTLSGAPGSTTTLTAIVSNQVQGVPVTFTLSTASGSVLSPIQTNSAGQAQTTILLPSSSATVTVSASGYRAATASISVTGGTTGTTTPTPTPTVSEPASIEIYDGDDQQGEINQRLDEDLVVQVLDRNNNGVSFELVRFRIVEGRGRVSPSSTRTDRDGLADVTFTPRSQGMIEVEASVGDLSPVTFTVNIGEPADAIKKISGDNQSGRPGARLANPFVVEVVDENDDPVSGATVTFAVTAGGGSVSPTSATTNASGRAQTVLTLGDEIGDNTVTARVTGLRAVTFTAGAGATVHVDASNRAPIYWIDKQNGTLHRLVDDDVENLASNVEGVTSLAVDEANGLIYWGVQVGRSGGKIQRSRLNGRNVQTLKDRLTSIPMGIALDAAGGTIYWTSASGKIRSMATEGSTRVTKILEDLSDPTSLAVSNGYLYWAEPLGRVRRVNLTATRKVPANIATGLGEPLSIAIAKGKIYWVERNGGKGGSLQRANLNGTQIEELKAFTGGVPLGISIDSSDNKIYWTKLSKIQRTNLTGRSVIDVVTGLTRPSAIALGVVTAAEPPAQTTRRTQTTQTTQTTTQTTYSKYDINKDGSVNNADTKAVAGAVGQSGTAITNPRTDVDGSGTVDVTDLILVIANLDDDVAAPAIDVDLTAMDLDFDRVAEQVEVLLASGDRSHAAQRTLLYLQHLLASARPDATVLLVNYPNPFNPETWIPYHLATSTDVKINIYNAQGILVRSLTLGHQSAGYYTSRSRAAYWDGRNALGERVASGIYFYQLQADEISPLRKMVILK